MKVVEMQPGEYAWGVAGIYYELEKWEAYNFLFNQWEPAANFTMYGQYPWRNFDEILKDIIASLPPEATVYVYKSNESFGALREKSGVGLSEGG